MHFTRVLKPVLDFHHLHFDLGLPLLGAHLRFSGLLAHLGELFTCCFELSAKILIMLIESLQHVVMRIMGLLHSLDVFQQSIVTIVQI